MTSSKKENHSQRSSSHGEWLSKSYRVQKERLKNYSSISFLEQPALVSAEEQRDFDPNANLGYPGEFPFTRGVQASMYRGRLWTMRQFAGFGTQRTICF